ncbi:hypothetical protein TREES_T100000826 [Tupaia chinensis]|uniref:Uncharacterized protein n=1 Tax=Tupaia chinensis TaxID=246437 RepID=L9JK01_TUPCH|nr:hypothetical protein TREES_T100000826 [Tupaia chinensis]
MKRIEEMQRKETSFQDEIIISEEKAHNNRLRAHAVERAVVEKTQEIIYLKDRLAAMHRQWMLEGLRLQNPVPRGPDMDRTPQRGESEHHAFPTKINYVIPPERPKKEQVDMFGKGPRPFQGPPYVPHPAQSHASPYEQD